MNDDQPTDQSPNVDEPGPEHGDKGFDAGRLRTVTDMRRSMSDALLGGVSTGAARYLNLDPVIVRIGFVILTFFGGAGLILYLAAWFLLPSEHGPSYAQEWFNLDENEERVRVGGLIVAGAIALLSIVGDTGWGWGSGHLGWIIPTLALIALIAFLPRRRRETQAAQQYAATQPPPPPPGYTASAAPVMTAPTKPHKEPRSRVLLALTASVIAIAMAITRLVSEGQGGTEWTTYVAIALTIVGLAVLTSTFWGDGGLLILVGLILAGVLAAGTVMPSLRMGQQVQEPNTAANVEGTYTHGAGQFVLDLSDVSDPEALLGRTVDVDTGMGQTRILLPTDLAVEVETSVHAGDIRAFDQNVNGTQVEIGVPADDSPHLTLNVEHRLGSIEVIRK